MLLTLTFLLTTVVLRSQQQFVFDDNFVVVDDMMFKKPVKTKTDAMNYLEQFGYMPQAETRSRASNEMNLMLMDFQRFMHLNETGKLDKKTMDMMSVPRCGVPDNVNPNGNGVYRTKMAKRRFRRYQLEGSVWYTRNVSWKITTYSQRSELRGRQKQVNEIMKAAFKEWSRHSNLRFYEETTSKPPMIEIKFATGEHHDGNPFDGPGRILAHAFFPNAGGDMHFDDHEMWTIEDDKPGIDLKSVAVHEIGHSLGLGHSDQFESLMYPTYSRHRRSPKLDDIKAIEMLYGRKEKEDKTSDKELKKKNEVLSGRKETKNKKHKKDEDKRKSSSKSSAKSPSGKSPPDLCSDFRIDAADCMSDGKCFFFRDEFVWRIDEETGIYPGYPKPIGEVFPGVSGKIDAAATDMGLQETLLFKKDKVWVFKEAMRKPVMKKKKISDVISNISVTRIDAASEWGFNGRTYLFKDDVYWRYDSHRVKLPVSRRYPNSIGVWGGVPNDLDAVMFWPVTGKTYFFKGRFYYRFDDAKSSVEEADPPFPREANEWWLKCS